MAQWKTGKITLPDPVVDLAKDAGKLADKVATFLDAVASTLDVVAAFSKGSFDAYSVIVNSFIDAVEDFLQDWKAAGVYTLIDYPQNFNFDNLVPLAPSNMGGTLVDPRALALLTSDDAGRRDGDGNPLPPDPQANLNAIARLRSSWNPPSRDMLSYRQAVQRITQAFDDPQDQFRPQFSDSASTIGVVVMLHSESLATFMQLVRNINNIFAFDGLDQIKMPDFERFFSDLGKPFDELTPQDLCELDLTVPFSLRSGGTHPNFLGPVSIGAIFPGLGKAMDALSQLVDQLRPTGDTAKLIQDSIKFLQKKIERLVQIAEELEALSEQLAALGALELSWVTIKSDTGNEGFKAALQNSTGHPEFDRALVVSLVFYAGANLGAGKSLETLFSDAGDTIESSVTKAVENAKRHRARPVLKP